MQQYYAYFIEALNSGEMTEDELESIQMVAEADGLADVMDAIYLIQSRGY